MDETEKKANNPNSDARELKEAMLFEREDGTPLIEPMIFYDRPLNPNYPLPKIKPLGAEYFINLKKLEEQSGKILFADDISNHLQRLLPKATEKHKTPCKNIQNLESSLNSKPQKEIDTSEKPYFIMKEFLSKVNIKVIDNEFYYYNGITYVAKTDLEISSLIFEKCLKRFVNKSSSLINDVRHFLKIEPKIQVNADDVPRHYIAFQNGILDIRNRRFYKHSPAYLTLFEVKANYCPSANISTPIFDNYLMSITGGDAELIERILQVIGYILTPDTNGKCFFLVQGVPDSGKSVFCNLLKKFFNKSACKPLEAHLLGEKFTASELLGKAFCTFPDMSGAPLDDATVSRIKMFTGNDVISVPVRYKANAELTCTAKIISATNHPFLTKNGDEAFFNRIITIPFAFPVDTNRKTKELDALLFTEKDGIATKSIAAYFRLVDAKYAFAGNFKPNQVISDSISVNENCEIQIFKYVKNNFYENPNGIVFIDDALYHYRQKYGVISKNEFSHFFQQYAFDILSGTKSRKRKIGTTNPISCIMGISFKEENSNGISKF